MLIKRMVAGLLSTVLVASSLLQPLAVYAETVIVEQATALTYELLQCTFSGIIFVI